MNLTLFNVWRKSNRIQKLILFTYIISYIIATSTHLIDLIRLGLFPYEKFPLWANIYWTLLTVLDPLAILFLFVNVRAGLVFYGLIIISDVLINIFFTLSLEGFIGVFNVFMLSQLLFLLFYTFSVKLVWNIQSDKTRKSM